MMKVMILKSTESDSSTVGVKVIKWRKAYYNSKLTLSVDGNHTVRHRKLEGETE